MKRIALAMTGESRVRHWMLIATVFAAGCSSEPEMLAKPMLVRTVIVGSSGAQGPTLTGTVHARIESALGFRVGGKIVTRYVEAGQHVHRGQPLARIDASDYALLATAAHSDAEAASAQQRRAGADLARLKPLADKGFVSIRALDAARAEADASAALMRAARANAANAANQSGYATLVADADGIVMSVEAEPGQVVAPGQTIVRLGRSGSRDAVVSVPEQLRAQATGAVSVSLFDGGKLLDARLRSLSAAADPATRTFEARYTLAGGDTLPLGGTATVRLAGKSGAAIRIPIAALIDRGSGPGVWIVGDHDQLVFRPVRIAGLDEEDATLSAGLHGGERIVALGAHLLRPGQKVRIEDVRPAI